MSVFGVGCVPGPATSSSEFDRSERAASVVHLTKRDSSSTIQSPNPQLKKSANLNSKALEFLFQGHYDTAFPIAREALALRMQSLSSDHLDVAESFTTLGLILYQRLELVEAEARLRKALAIRQQKLGDEHLLVADSRLNLARVLNSSGDYTNAKELLTQALEIFNQDTDTFAVRVGSCLTHLAIVSIHMGDIKEAMRFVLQAVEIFEVRASENDEETAAYAMALNVMGTVRSRIGDYVGARQVLERSLSLREQSLGVNHPHIARTLINLGTLAAKRGDLDTALSLLERARVMIEDSLGSENAEMSGILNEVGRVHRLKGDLESAKSHFERARVIQEKTIGPKHPFLALTLNELGRVYQQQDKWRKAKLLYLEALQIQEASLGHQHLSLSGTLSFLGYIEGRQGNLASAERHVLRALNIRRDVLGSTHPDVASSLIDVARVYHGKGDVSQARQYYKQARALYVQLATLYVNMDDETSRSIWRRQRAGLEHYLLLLDSVASTGQRDTQDLSVFSDGFVAAEQARGWKVQAAVAKALAKRKMTNASTVQVASRIEDLRQERQGLWNRIHYLVARSGKERDEETLMKLRAQAKRVEQDLNAGVSTLRKQSPRYAELAIPQPMALQHVQQLLRDGEALISFYTLPQQVQIWVVRADSPIIYRSTRVSRHRIGTLVKRIRNSLMPKQGDSRNEMVLPAFDVKSAHELYQALLKPVESFIENTQELMIIPDSILLPLPFGVLLTNNMNVGFKKLATLYQEGQSPSMDNMYLYQSLPWLAQHHSLSILPSATVLKLIRGTSTESGSPSVSFLGFGDPILKGKGFSRGGTMLLSKGMNVDRGALLKMNRLPGTRDELLALARALQVPRDGHVFLDKDATETTVRKLHAKGQLGKANILAFATHGLLAGELGLTQPALVLTPPAQPDEHDDGLVSMEEILQWQLPNTDWVVLSACNTGGSDGSDEGLSGLSRAFFYAGAKTLLVSHWSVDDYATQRLMTEVFSRYGRRNKTVSPALALQQGMLALLMAQSNARTKDPPYFSHPFAWASFFLVGPGH
ncbi:MAG: hypothetical protein NPIRA04_31320 [Nitrospirales bacterium]|nr:MAG: hypothetical protein NPIRA04_31320 [Nitrospirales bacterium]